MTQQLTRTYTKGIEINVELSPEFAEIVTPEAMDFIALLTRAFEERRADLLQERVTRQTRLDAGKLPQFIPETTHIRTGDWTISPIPADLQDRRVEITGPLERRMIINALNSGARTFIADFEDAHSPTWEGTIQGQINLRDAIRRSITFTNPAGKVYSLHEKTAVLMLRPRGWHLNEKHILIDGKPISASIFDFGLYFFHNAHQLLANGTGPYFYLPKLEGRKEARLWNEIFVRSQKELGIPQGTIKATVVIETILAAFEMDEILYELRQHSAGLSCGRWDYIFSTIKKLRNQPAFIFPDRTQVTMTTHFMRSYSLLTIRTCHQRKAQAIGGMAAQIPIKNNPVANKQALDQVRADKKREATAGHDGTWVAHPDLVSIAQEEFDAVMPGPNQVARLREDVQVSATDLLQVPQGTITEAGLRNNISVSLQYLASWLQGQGCVPINHLMEDVATVEISRAQIWQWIRHPQGLLDDGRKVTMAMFHHFLVEELTSLKPGADSQRANLLNSASEILDTVISASDFVEFLTLPAYRYLP